VLLDNNGSVIQGSSQEYNKLRNIISVLRSKRRVRMPVFVQCLILNVLLIIRFLKFLSIPRLAGNNIKFWKAAGDAGRGVFCCLTAILDIILWAYGNTLDLLLSLMDRRGLTSLSTLFLRK
jgi:hypothetical protein